MRPLDHVTLRTLAERVTRQILVFGLDPKERTKTSPFLGRQT
jgi:hypothetical protein